MVADIREENYNLLMQIINSDDNFLIGRMENTVSAPILTIENRLIYPDSIIESCDLKFGGFYNDGIMLYGVRIELRITRNYHMVEIRNAFTVQKDGTYPYFDRTELLNNILHFVINHKYKIEPGRI